ncbi:MAG: aspartate/glutamate racemase family protein [Anaerolineae bacterium]|nr:aspartate/glutamate racemase family protein [Anaerolineae bacterium]
MKTIGLVGGMSWHSSLEYYRIINEEIHATLGGAHSAQCLLYSVDFAPIDALERENRSEEALAPVITAAQSVERGGADFVAICTNTVHRFADKIQAAIRVPLLHIGDATGRAIRAAGLETVGLLGTRFTMEEDFIKGKLASEYGLTVLVPPADDRTFVNRVIYDELCVGRMLAESRAEYAAIMARLVDRGAAAVILGCTEIGLLVGPEDATVPLFDTARIHAKAIAAAALAE